MIEIGIKSIADAVFLYFVVPSFVVLARPSLFDSCMPSTALESKTELPTGQTRGLFNFTGSKLRGKKKPDSGHLPRFK